MAVFYYYTHNQMRKPNFRHFGSAIMKYLKKPSDFYENLNTQMIYHFNII